MPKRAEKPAHISQEDWDAVDVPEATDEEWARAKPFKEVLPEQYAAWRKQRGRPRSETPKKHIGFRLAADVVDGVRASGRGYNARVENALRAMLEGEDKIRDMERELRAAEKTLKAPKARPAAKARPASKAPKAPPPPKALKAATKAPRTMKAAPTRTDERAKSVNAFSSGEASLKKERSPRKSA